MYWYFCIALYRRIQVPPPYVWSTGNIIYIQQTQTNPRDTKQNPNIIIVAVRDIGNGTRREELDVSLSNTCLFPGRRRRSCACVLCDHSPKQYYEQMWPPLHILSFWLLPKHWRPLTSHLAGVALLAVISSTGLTDADLPLGQRAVPLMMRWAREASDAVGERVRANGRRVSGAPRDT